MNIKVMQIVNQIFIKKSRKSNDKKSGGLFWTANGYEQLRRR